MAGDAALLRAPRGGRHGDRPGGKPSAVRAGREQRQDHQALPGDVARADRRGARRQRGGRVRRHHRVAGPSERLRGARPGRSVADEGERGRVERQPRFAGGRGAVVAATREVPLRVEGADAASLCHVREIVM